MPMASPTTAATFAGPRHVRDAPQAPAPQELNAIPNRRQSRNVSSRRTTIAFKLDTDVDGRRTTASTYGELLVRAMSLLGPADPNSVTNSSWGHNPEAAKIADQSTALTASHNLSFNDRVIARRLELQEQAGVQDICE